MSKVSTDECMLWARGATPNGYGNWTTLVDGKRERAHRVMYELLIGEIPEGMTVDHLCGNPPCINVEHMEIVTIQENILRSTGISVVNRNRTACKNGHPLYGDNLYVYKNMRGCIICRRQRTSTWDREHRLYSNGVRYTV
jgi:hypothetical protein